MSEPQNAIDEHIAWLQNRIEVGKAHLQILQGQLLDGKRPDFSLVAMEVATLTTALEHARQARQREESIHE